MDTSGIKSASSAVSCSFKSAFAILMLRMVQKKKVMAANDAAL